MKQHNTNQWYEMTNITKEMLNAEIKALKNELKGHLAQMEQRINQLEGQNKEQSEEIKRLTQTNLTLENKLKEKSANASIDVSEWSTVVKRNAKKPVEQLTVVNAAINETIDREKRAKNVVIYGVPESKQEKKEEEDKSKVENIFKEIEVNSSNIKFIKRLKSREETKPGPILVGLNDTSERNPVLVAARKLRNKSEMKNIYVSPDMTEAQRLEDYQLRKKRNELNNGRKDNEPFRYAIRGSTIVKFAVKTTAAATTHQ